MLKGEFTLTKNKSRAKKGSMPKDNFSLDDIQLSGDDANKPADIDLSPQTVLADEGEDGTVTENPLVQKQDEDLSSKINEDGSQKDDTTTGEEDGAKKSADAGDGTQDGAKPDDSGGTGSSTEEEKTEGKETEGDNTKSTADDGKSNGFHNHPDWIKMQQDKREAELEAARLRGQVEVLDKKTTPEDQREERKTERQKASDIAARRFEEKVKEGWNPKSRLEEQRVYAEFFEEELDRIDLEKQKEAYERSVQEDKAKAEVETKITETITGLGVSDADDQKKVRDLVEDWHKQGMGVSWNSFKVAKEFLEAKGELGKKADPEVFKKDEDAKAKEKADLEAKNKVNGKISKPTSSGEKPNDKPKRNYQKEKKMTLDDLVLDLGKTLG